MKSNHYYKFSAVASASSGILWIVGWTMNIGRDNLIGASLGLAGYVLAIFGFAGIAAIQRERLSIVGFVGFAITAVACMLFIPWVFLDIARISGTAPGVDWWFVERNGPTGTIAIIGGACFVLGFIIVGIETIRNKVLSRWPAYLIILAALQPAFFPFTGLSKMLARIAGIALMGFAWNLWAASKLENERNEREK